LRSFRNALVLVLVAGACKPATRGKASVADDTAKGQVSELSRDTASTVDSGTTPQYAVAPPVSSRHVPATSGESVMLGDTLELVSIGSRVLPNWRDRKLPCDSARTPAFERLVFYDDSSYFGMRAARPGCRDKFVSSSDTVQWGSIYRVHGDTLTLYTGDGDEVFESFNGRLTTDSVIQIDAEARDTERYVRRRGTQR
jgi:hypothetical protein